MTTPVESVLPADARHDQPAPVHPARASSRQVAALCAVFALSGAAALIFETLWFRQAGLLVGNSVWASSLVMASLMGGLACGNAAGARWGGRLGLSLAVYAALETVAGLSGLALVPLLPGLAPWLAPVFRALADRPLLLNGVRSGLAFLLLLVPAGCMGATLPVLVCWLTAHREGFGRALGRLYGWNTLGAVVGALAGGGFLLDRLGVRGTALVGALLNVTAALVAAALARAESRVGFVPPRPTTHWGRISPRVLLASALSGCILLALEVVWFRFLLLFVHGSSLTFGIMLSVVLAGIALGSLGASMWLKVTPEAWRLLPTLALSAGTAVVLTYAHFVEALSPFGAETLVQPGRILLVSIQLMLPVSTLSGVLFTFMGQALKKPAADDAGTAGALTMANTVGAMAGAFVAGFLLLPRLGIERSLFALACAYAGVALLVAADEWSPLSRAGQRGLVLAAATVFFLGTLGLFPFGLLRNHYQKRVMARWTTPATRLVAVREGLTETILYLRTDLADEPVSYRLLTNAFSMSAARVPSGGYMELFVHLPLAMNPNARRALLISYGVGSTAQALTNSRGLERIDVVDTSRDILDLGRIVFDRGEPYPLDDPRVRVRVEDGRFFLATTSETYDLITGEPPPPKNAGIANLYSRDYFRLMRGRLAAGGVASYWLPVFQLAPDDAKAIVRGFCDAFEDCSLWMGFGPEWILLGTRDLEGPVSVEGFTRQWHDRAVAPKLAALGLENPAHLGALFIADAASLRDFAKGAAPLDDDHPGRLSQRFIGQVDPFYVGWADPAQALDRFQRSEFIRRLWPEPLRSQTRSAFHDLDAVKQYMWDSFGVPRHYLSQVHTILTKTKLRAPVLWMLQSSAAEIAAAHRARGRGVAAPELDEVLGVEAMADRDYLLAERLFQAAEPRAADPERLRQWRSLALCLADRGLDARGIMTERPRDPAAAAAWAQIDAVCDRPGPGATTP